MTAKKTADLGHCECGANLADGGVVGVYCSNPKCPVEHKLVTQVVGAFRAHRAAETVADMDNLRHMLGVGSHISKRSWGYRNYFNAGEGHAAMPSLLRLEAAGLVVRNPARLEYWYATEAGCKAIGLTPAQIKKVFAP